MEYFTHLGINPSPEEVYQYIQKVESNEVILEGIQILSNKNYLLAKPYIQKKLDWANWWYNQYHDWSHSRGKDLALKMIQVCEEALKKFDSLENKKVK